MPLVWHWHGTIFLKSSWKVFLGTGMSWFTWNLCLRSAENLRKTIGKMDALRGQQTQNPKIHWAVRWSLSTWLEMKGLPSRSWLQTPCGEVNYKAAWRHENSSSTPSLHHRQLSQRVSLVCQREGSIKDLENVTGSGGLNQRESCAKCGDELSGGFTQWRRCRIMDFPQFTHSKPGFQICLLKEKLVTLSPHTDRKNTHPTVSIPSVRFCNY